MRLDVIPRLLTDGQLIRIHIELRSALGRWAPALDGLHWPVGLSGVDQGDLSPKSLSKPCASAYFFPQHDGLIRQELKLADGQTLVISSAPNGLHDSALRMLLGTQ